MATENGIIIDVGFKADVQEFVNDINKEFKKVDFDDAIGLSEAFKKQEEEVRNQLKKLKQVIDETINGKIPNDPSKQLTVLNKAVTILAANMKDMVKAMPASESQKFAGNIENITGVVNELSGACQNALDVVDQLGKSGSNISFGDTKALDQQKKKMEEICEQYKSLVSIMKGIEASQNAIGVNREGKVKYKNSDSIVKEIQLQYQLMLDLQDKYQNALEENDQKLINDTTTSYGKKASFVSKLINEFDKLYDPKKASLDSISFDGIETPIAELKLTYEDDFEDIKKIIANNINEINSEYQKLGGKDLNEIFSKQLAQIGARNNPLTVPIDISTTGKGLTTKALEVIYATQNNLKDHPLTVEVQLLSTWKAKDTQSKIDALIKSTENIEDTEVKQKILDLTSQMSKRMKDALIFDVNVSTEKATVAVHEFVNSAKTKLKELAENARLEPEVVLNDENKEKFQQQLNKVTDGFKIKIGIDNESGDFGKKTEDVLAYIRKLTVTINRVENAVNNKSLAFINEDGIVKEVVENESAYLNHLYGDLISIEGQINDIITAFKNMPESFSIKVDDKSLGSLNSLLASNALSQISEATNAINEAISINTLNNIGIPEEEKNRLCSDIQDLINKIDVLYKTDGIKNWSSEFINSLDKISQKIKTLFGGNNTLNDMIKDWKFSDEMMRNEKGEDHLRERAAAIASDGEIYGYSTYDQSGGTVFLPKIQHKLVELGLVPEIGIHSHGSDRIGAASLPQGNDDLGDLNAWAQEYKEKIYGNIKKQLIISLNDIQLFDAKGFFDSNSSIDFIDDSDINDRIGEKEKEIFQEISYNLNKYFENFVKQYGTGDGLNLKDNILNNSSLSRGTPISLRNKFSIIKSFIDKNVSPQIILDEFYKKSKTSNNNISVTLASSFTDALSNSIDTSQKELSQIISEESGFAISSTDLYEIFRKMQENIVINSQDIINNTFGIKDFDYGASEASTKGVGKKTSDRDLWAYAFRQETPRILSEALEGTGYKNNYQDYMKSYTTDEFIKQNPLGLSSGTLSDMFNISATTEFLGTLDKIVEDLTQIKSSASSNELKDMFNIKFDEASAKEFSDVINNLVSKMEELVSLFNGSNPMDKIANSLNTLANVFDTTAQSEKELESVSNSLTDKMSGLTPYVNFPKFDEKHSDELSEIISLYEKYLTLGGKSSLSELFNENNAGSSGSVKVIESIENKAKLLGVSFEELKNKETEVTNPLQKLDQNFNKFSTGIDAFTSSIDRLIESLKTLPEALFNIDYSKISTKNDVLKNDGIENGFKVEGNTVNTIISKEIKELELLEEQIDYVTTAINNKTEAFKREGEVVSGVIPNEVKSLDPLKNLESAYNNFKPFFDNGDLESEAGSNAALSYYNSYKEALISKVNKKDLKQYTIGDIDDLFTGNYTNYKKGVEDLDISNLDSLIAKYQEIVDKLNQPEVINIINSLSEAIKKLLESGEGSETTTAFLKSLNRLIDNLSDNKSAEKIQAIADNLINLKDSLNSLNVTDNGFINTLSSILDKGESLKDLAEVLKHTQKQMNNAAKATRSKTSQNNNSNNGTNNGTGSTSQSFNNESALSVLQRTQVGTAKAYQDAFDGMDFTKDINQAAKMFFERYAKNIGDTEGLSRSKVTIDTNSGGEFKHAELEYYNEALKQTITETWYWNKQNEEMIVSNIRFVDSIKQREKAEEKEKNKLVSAQKELQKYLAMFGNKTLGQMNNNPVFQELSNFTISSFDDIEKAKNLMTELDTQYNEILINARKGSSSLNPFVNMITGTDKAESAIESLRLDLYSLNEIPNKLSADFKSVASVFEEIKVASANNDIEAISEAYGRFRTQLNAVVAEYKLLKKEQNLSKVTTKSYQANTLFDESIYTDANKLVNLEKSLELDGRLTDDLKQRIYNLFDSLGNIEDPFGYKMWKKSFEQFRNDLTIIKKEQNGVTKSAKEQSEAYAKMKENTVKSKEDSKKADEKEVNSLLQKQQSVYKDILITQNEIEKEQSNVQPNKLVLEVLKKQKKEQQEIYLNLQKQLNLYPDIVNNASRIQNLHDNTIKERGNIDKTKAYSGSATIAEFKKELSSVSSLLSRSFKGDSLGTEVFINSLQKISGLFEKISSLSENGLIQTDEFNKLAPTFDKLKESLRFASIDKIDTKNKTPEFIEKLTGVSNSLHDINEIIDKIKSKEVITEEDNEKIRTFTKSFKELSSVANSEENKLAKDISINKLLGKIFDNLHKNSAMSKELKKNFITLGEQVTQFDGKIPVDKMNEFVNTFFQLDTVMKKEGKLGLSFFDKIKTQVVNKSAGLLAQYFGLYDIIRYLKQGIQVVHDLDDAFTEMQKVSDETAQSLRKFQKESFALADSVGSTAKQIQDSTASWMRLGKSLKEATKLAQEVSILKNVSEFESIEAATESMVSATQAFQDLDSMEIIDKYNNIGNSFQISTDQIARGMQNAGSALVTAGNDIDEAIALLTAGNSVVQDIDRASAGIRTISLRLRGTDAKAELEEMGEDAEGLVETTVKLQDQVKALTTVGGKEGVSLINDNGNLRSTYEILLDISKVWEDIGKQDLEDGTNRQAALLEKLSGKNRANILSSILTDPQLLEDVYTTSQDSVGSAQEELDKYLESISGHTDRLKNAWQEMWANTANREVINFFLDLAKSLVNVVNELGLIPSLLGTVFAFFTAKNLLKSGGRARFNETNLSLICLLS